MKMIDVIKESNILTKYKIEMNKDIKLAEKLADSCSDIDTLHDYIDSEYRKIDKLNLKLNNFNYSTEKQKLHIIDKYNKKVEIPKQVKSQFGYINMINSEIDTHRKIISIFNDRLSYLLFPNMSL